jgi:hypothetical protein
MHNHDQNSNIPRWAAPWAAGWSSMSDISRIETDAQSLHRQADVSHRSKPLRRVRVIGLAAGALTAMWVAATVLL